MEELITIIDAKPHEFYNIVVHGYIEPTDQTATLAILDDEGRILGRTVYNENSGIFNAHMSVMMNNFDGMVVLSVMLENANWVLTEVIHPLLSVRKVG